MIKSHYPTAQIGFAGGEMPFPADPDDGKLDAFLGINACRSFSQGLEDTLAEFAQAQSRGILDTALVNQLIEKNS